MLALIDADILAYEFGALKVSENRSPDFLPDMETGDPMPFEVCWGALCNRIASICKAVRAERYRLYLSSQEIKTWRYEAATILPYKGSRHSDRPPHWEDLRINMTLHHPHVVCEFIEADDALSIEQYTEWNNLYESYQTEEDLSKQLTTIICTRDKDLNMVPGWHYGWGLGNQPEKPLWFQTSLEGRKCFYKQLIQGDATDNILGLYGVGPKSSLIAKIDKMTSEGEMFRHVYKCYVDRFGMYARQFMTENGQLLKMQETREQRWNPWNTGDAERWLNESEEQSNVSES